MAAEGQVDVRRQILVTQNTEYLLRGNTCIAVRDHQTGERDRTHVAIGSQLLGVCGISPGRLVVVAGQVAYPARGPTRGVRLPGYDIAAARGHAVLI